MRRRVGLRELGFWYAVGACILKPLTLAFTRRQWSGVQNVPERGGVILAANHISHVDPIVLVDYVVFGTGRPGRFLAKSSMFRGGGLVARVMRGAHQIPVHRQTADASSALHDAVTALQQGECVVLYPEGTVTRDPDRWPMRARTGVARLALLSGAPVVPVAQWGAQEVFDSYVSKRPHLLPPHVVQVVAGPPVDLSAFAGQPLSADVLRRATDAVMADLTALVATLRDEAPPTEQFDPRQLLPVADQERETA